MTLLVDNWADQRSALASAGWVIVEYSRYDPTHVAGLTPTGKAFTLDCVGDTVTVTVAGRTRTVNVPKADWEQGHLTRQRMLDAYNAFPASQR